VVFIGLRLKKNPNLHILLTTICNNQKKGGEKGHTYSFEKRFLTKTQGVVVFLWRFEVLRKAEK